MKIAGLTPLLMLAFYVFCLHLSCWKIQAIVDTLNNDRADKIYLEEVNDGYSGDLMSGHIHKPASKLSLL
jgi:hypothetical protein